MKKHAPIPPPPNSRLVRRRDDDDDDSDSMVQIEKTKQITKIRKKIADAPLEERYARAHTETAVSTPARANAADDASESDAVRATKAVYDATSRKKIDISANPVADSAARPVVAAPALRTQPANAVFDEQRPRAIANEQRANATQSIAEHATYLIEVRKSALLSPSHTPKVPMVVSRAPSDETFLHWISHEAFDPQRPQVLTPDQDKAAREDIIASTRAHENKFLRKARENEPRCAAEHCKGLDLLCAEPDDRLVVYIPPDEWAKYEQATSAGKKVVIPQQYRSCLLCIRYAAMAAVANMTAANVALRHGETFTSIPIYNLLTPNEYRAEDCLLPSPYTYEGHIAPVVKYDPAGFERCVDRTTGIVYFRQLNMTPLQFEHMLAERRAMPPPTALARADETTSHF